MDMTRMTCRSAVAGFSVEGSILLTCVVRCMLSVNRETRKYSINECGDDLQPAHKNAL
jgi:hypothetical protein